LDQFITVYSAQLRFNHGFVLTQVRCLCASTCRALSMPPALTACRPQHCLALSCRTAHTALATRLQASLRKSARQLSVGLACGSPLPLTQRNPAAPIHWLNDASTTVPSLPAFRTAIATASSTAWALAHATYPGLRGHLPRQGVAAAEQNGLMPQVPTLACAQPHASAPRLAPPCLRLRHRILPAATLATP
jgi:hypothetical protein